MGVSSLDLAALPAIGRRPFSGKMILQLNPPLPLTTPKGNGLAHFLIDYGPESDLLWVVFLNEGGQCWAVPNPQITLAPNWSMGRN